MSDKNLTTFLTEWGGQVKELIEPKTQQQGIIYIIGDTIDRAMGYKGIFLYYNGDGELGVNTSTTQSDSAEFPRLVLLEDSLVPRMAQSPPSKDGYVSNYILEFRNYNPETINYTITASETDNFTSVVYNGSVFVSTD